MVKILMIALLVGSMFVSPAIALFAGILFAISFKHPFEKYSKIASKYLLQISVIGLGFGMNLHDSLSSSSEGMMFTIVSVVGVMVIGYFLGKAFKIDKKLSYLVSSGTAICGGSAIAAISPVIKADSSQMSMSLAVVFTLNAIALFIFPAIGHFFDMTQQEFGTWVAIAIHDTSSVVGAGSAYGPEALMVATTIKLTRALWIIPLAIVSTFFFKSNDGKKNRISIPWFIFLFILAMIFNTYVQLDDMLLTAISTFSHKCLNATMFLIGTGLSLKAIKEVGAKPILQGVTLWVLISVVAFLVIMF